MYEVSKNISFEITGVIEHDPHTILLKSKDRISILYVIAITISMPFVIAIKVMAKPF